MNDTRRDILAELLKIAADLDVDDLLRLLQYAARLRDARPEAA